MNTAANSMRVGWSEFYNRYVRLKARVLCLTVMTLSASACGTYVPDIEPGGEPNAHAFLINRIVNHVKCELRDALVRVIDYDIKNAAQQPDRKRHLRWLETWSAKLQLKIIVDEKGALNPNATWTTPLVDPKSFVLGASGLFSSEATRTETVDYFFVFSDLLKKPRLCVETGGILINGDLKIYDWLWSSVFPFFLPENVYDVPPDVFTDQIDFVVVVSGTATPTWNLVRVVVNPSGPFASAMRTRTDELILTIGPVGGTLPKGTKVPSAAMESSFFAAQIGSAVSAAIRNQH